MLALTLPLLARAATPEDITLSGMSEHGGVAIVASLEDDYLQLIRELGTAVAARPGMPAETVGAYGFDVATGVQAAFIDTTGTSDDPSPWERAHPSEDPGPFLYMPYVSVRKGLPLSTEIGTDVAWLGGSSQLSLSGYGRVAIVEGYRPAPDLSIRLGYSAYVGNDELELGVIDLGATLGTTVPFGPLPIVRNGRFSPWIEYTTLRVRAAPILSDELATQIGAVQISSGKTDAAYTPASIVPVFAGGMLIQGGVWSLRLSGSWAPTAIVCADVGMGATW
jgi:hypothetical protein